MKHQITVTLDEDIVQILDKKAEEDKRKRSNYLNLVLGRVFEKELKKARKLIRR